MLQVETDELRAGMGRPAATPLSIRAHAEPAVSSFCGKIFPLSFSGIRQF